MTEFPFLDEIFLLNKTEPQKQVPIFEKELKCNDKDPSISCI